MRNTILGILVLAMIGGGVAAFVHTQNSTPEAKRAKLAEEFLGVLPDSLGDRHRQEILTLFENLWERHERGLVAQADVDTIMISMQDYVDAGSISGAELVHYMAEVGYKTYSGEERYRLPSGMVDHPELNPKSALVDLMPDTAGFAEWLLERERTMKEEEQKDEETNDR